MEVRPYQPSDFAGLDRLWHLCFPDDPPRNRAAVAVPAKLALNDDLLLVAVNAEQAVIGSVLAGYDGHRGWLYAVAVDPDYQRRGIGQRLVDAAIARLAERGCTKVNLQIRAGNEQVVAFYAALGFATEPRISMGKLLG
jgi:ribosomal protein S18 acetylase RimI-like enzyme